MLARALIVVVTCVVVASGFAIAADPGEPPYGKKIFDVIGVIYENNTSPWVRIAGATLTILELGKSAVSDEDGYATIRNIVGGTYTMRVTADGYYTNTRYEVRVGWFMENPNYRYFAMDSQPDVDSDGDGLTDREEAQLGTDPNGVGKWAVLAIGGYTDQTWQDEFEYQADEAFRVLRSKGLTGTSIYYLDMTTSKRDADGDRRDDVDGLATKASVRYALETWLAGKADADDIVFIYLIDHGDVVPGTEVGEFIIGTEYVQDVELQAWLKPVACHNMTVVLEFCNAGYFSADLTDEPDEQNRLIVMASDKYSGTVTSGEGMLFSGLFFSYVASGMSLDDSAYKAKSVVQSQSGGRQVPMVTDTDLAHDIYL